MESSWRRNLGVYGLWDYDCGLCAPLPSPYPPNWILTNRYDPFGAHIVVYPPDTNPDLPYGVQTRPQMAAHFPYGFAVPPDVPV